MFGINKSFETHRSPLKMHLHVLFIICASVLECLGRYGVQQECSYEFNVWQADADQIERMRSLEIQFANFSNYVDKELLRFRLDNSVETSSGRNWTVMYERSLSELKNYQLQKYNELQELRIKLSQFEIKLEDLKGKVQNSVFPAGRSSRKKHVRKDRMVPNHAQADTPRHQLVENLKSLVSDLKAEWILIKRDFILIRKETDLIRKDHETLENKSDSIILQNEQFANMFKVARTKETAYEEDFTNFKLDLEQTKHDMVSIKSIQEQLKNDLLNQENGLVRLQAMCTDSRQRLEEMQTAHSSEWSKGAPTARKHPVENSIDPPDTKLWDENDIPKDCTDVALAGHRMSGVYRVHVGAVQPPSEVYCQVDPVGYTVIQRRVDGLQDFDRGWLEYKFGFGNIYGEFWAGNELIYELTKNNEYGLRVDIWDWEGNITYAEYDTFMITDEVGRYALHVSGYSGNAGDSLSYHDGMKFSTKDLDNDIHDRNCAAENKGGWWFSECYFSHLNGMYHVGWYAQAKYTFADGIVWYTLKDSDRYSLRKVEMKLKRRRS
ncbi:ANGP1-like protein [Mya arenaria]|uniref:ANGP1-like protein n=1 Tax=Mya arenaria TaxID=6604 RepID=A0ABY7DV45_MYAAR|nr:angiopoietin-related protein 7-like [Mya arenaria]XP_052796409.1 angiopoietin-related protein 7-like [Mya arenaria]WAR00477.1 ANGP1-like protein [Mya arenaria]WAR00491.1 ANGP1-like protein [Mya arenaria]